MKPSENLYELVKSLTAEDKKFIRSSSQFHIKGKENKYTILFNEIEKQEAYREDELIKKMKYASDLNKFAFLKNYLYNFILECLEQKNFYIRKIVRSKITQAEILIRKNLFDIAFDLVAEAEEMSKKGQMFDLWLSTLETKKELYVAMDKNVDELNREMRHILRIKKSFIHYRRLFCIVRAKHHQTTFIRDIEKTKEFREVHEEELLESNPVYNFHHKLFFYLSKGIVYYAKKDFEKAYILVNELLKMWHKHEWMIEIRFSAYYNTLYNKALIEADFQQYSKSIESISVLKNKLDELKRENPFERYMVFNLLVKVYNRCGYFDESLKIIDEYKTTRSLLQRSTINPHSEQLYHFYMADVYFGTADFKLANKHINEIINNSIEYNNDLTCIAQLISLIIHYELGNSDLLAYRIKSAYRFLTKRDCLQLTIGHVLDFLRKSGKGKNSQKTDKERFVELKSQITEDLKIDPIQKDILQYFDILSWLESRIQNKPFMEIVKAKSGYALEQKSEVGI
jgi:hypothetical protein